MAQFYRFSSKLNRIQSNPFLSSSFSGIRQNRSLSSISTRTSSLSGSVRLSTSARSRSLTTKAGNDANNNNTDNNTSNWTRWLPFVALVGVSFLAGRKTIAYAQDSDENEPKKKGILDWFWDKYDELVNEIDASVEDFVHEMARDPNDPNADESDLPLPNKLMAPLPEGYQRPITLLINLNVMIKQYHTAQSGTSVNIRPGILYFLDRLKSSKKFEVVVYTDSDKMEVDHLVSLLDTKQKYFALRIFKDVHINVDGKRYLPMEHLGRRSEHVIIIDDAFRVPYEHVNNVLPLKKWDGYHKNASDLLDTLPFLLRLGRTPYKDVREVLGFFHQNRLYIPDEYRKMRDENVRKDAAEMLQRASYLVDVHRTVPENMILDELEGTLETRIQTLKDRIAAKERGVSQHDLRLERIKRHDELLHAAVVAQEEKARRYGEPLSELSRRMPGGENVKITRHTADLLLDDHKQNKDQQQQQQQQD